MSRRDLVVVDSGRVVGAVVYRPNIASLEFDGAAVEVFATLRDRLGDVGLGEDLIAYGWSNGYLMLANVEELSTPAEAIKAEADLRAKAAGFLVLPALRYNPNHGKGGRFAGGHGGGGGGGTPEMLHDDEATIRGVFGYQDEQSGMVAEVSSIRSQGEGFSTYVTVDVKDRDGRVVGGIERTVRPADQKTVQADGMALRPGVQGQGFATRYNAKTETAYKAHGIERVTTYADIDVGGYSNARMGYDFADSYSRGRVVDRAVEVGRRFTPEIRAEINRVSGIADATPIEFAMIGYQAGASVWPGKSIMLGSGWNGVKEL
jgi:GNAT superfamily N-acetyltransferase